MRNLYIAYNGAMVTTAPLVGVTTGSGASKTLLQIAPTRPFRVVEWGISFSGSAAAAPITCELIETGTVFATVTAHVAAGVQPYSDPSLPAATVTLGTGATGYTASAEGTITATRTGDVQQVAPTNQYVKVFALGDEFQSTTSRCVRVRVINPGTAVNATTYIIFMD